MGLFSRLMPYKAVPAPPGPPPPAPVSKEARAAGLAARKMPGTGAFQRARPFKKLPERVTEPNATTVAAAHRLAVKERPRSIATPDPRPVTVPPDAATETVRLLNMLVGYAKQPQRLHPKDLEALAAGYAPRPGAAEMGGYQAGLRSPMGAAKAAPKMISVFFTAFASTEIVRPVPGFRYVITRMLVSYWQGGVGDGSAHIVSGTDANLLPATYSNPTTTGIHLGFPPTNVEPLLHDVVEAVRPEAPWALPYGRNLWGRGTNCGGNLMIWYVLERETPERIGR